MRILVVEDDHVLADGLVRALRQSSYAVDWARDGAEADSALANPVHDLVVLDLGLPKLEGLEVLRRLRLRDARRPGGGGAARGAGGERGGGGGRGAGEGRS